MEVTIDQLIAKLQEAKKLIGGDKTFQFWDNPDRHFTLTTGMWGIDAPIENKIAGDKSFVGFEIDCHGA